MQKFVIVLFVFWGVMGYPQETIRIDGNFDDWASVTTLVTDPAHDEHDTDWFGDGLAEPVPRKYSDVDILEVKFTHDRENLYGYVKARGVVGRTSRAADGDKAGRYYYIITIDVDDNDSTGYAIQEGNYWPNSIGYDMNMEVEFYDGTFNTGHYINHEFKNEVELEAGRIDLYNRIIRLAPGTYEHYLQWVVFPDSSIIEVKDKGPIYQGIIEVAVSEDGHEAEMKAPMWGFFWDENGAPIVKLGNTIDISFSLEGSGELSESAMELGYSGNRSVWGSDTAEPIVGYVLEDKWTGISDAFFQAPGSVVFNQNFPNPFNSSTTLNYQIEKDEIVDLTIYNVAGQKIATIVHERQTAGSYHIIWKAVDLNGQTVPSGVYLVILQTETERIMQRVLLLK